MIAPTERDWKHMRKIHDDLLARLCKRINTKTSAILEDPDVSEHKKYLAVYEHIQKSDDTVAHCFNDWRRSSILMKIASIKRENLITDEEFEALSEKIRNSVTTLLNIYAESARNG